MFGGIIDEISKLQGVSWVSYAEMANNAERDNRLGISHPVFCQDKPLGHNTLSALPFISARVSCDGFV